MAEAPDFSRHVYPAPTYQSEPGFGQLWSSTNEISIIAGAEQTWTITILDDDFIYYIDSIEFYCTTTKTGLFRLKLNSIVCAYGSFNTSFYVPLKDNPAVCGILSDIFEVYIKNLEADARTFGYVLLGTKFPKPSGWGKCPACSFSANYRAGITPADITFTGVASYSPTEFWYDKDELGYVSSVQSPVLTYSAAGIFRVMFKAKNTFGFDVSARYGYIAIAKAINPAGFTEVDPNAHISVAGQVVTITNLNLNESAYLYKDYGVGYFDAYDFLISFTPGVHTTFGHLVSFMLSNSVGDAALGLGKKLYILSYKAGVGDLDLYFRIQDGDVVLDQSSIHIAEGTNYVMRFVHVAGSTTATLNVYTDFTLSVLVGTISLTNASIATAFRYLYLCSSLNLGTNFPASGSLPDRGAISPSV